MPGHEHALSVGRTIRPAAVRQCFIYDDNGQHQAPSCADVLAEAGATVEIVTPDRSVAAEMGGVNFSIYLQRFYQKGVAMTPNHRLSGIEPVGNRLEVTFSNEFGGPDIARVVDHVVIGTVHCPPMNCFMSCAPHPPMVENWILMHTRPGCRSWQTRTDTSSIGS